MWIPANMNICSPYQINKSFEHVYQMILAVDYSSNSNPLDSVLLGWRACVTIYHLPPRKSTCYAVTVNVLNVYNWYLFPSCWQHTQYKTNIDFWFLWWCYAQSWFKFEDDNRASHHGDTRTLHVLLCYNYLFSINNMNIQHSKSIFIISSKY